jgi:hypothetical protein
MDETLAEALVCPRCVISVIGDHAGEGLAPIFKRKIEDIEKMGQTFWVVRSRRAQPAQVQEMSKTEPAYVVFVGPATKGGARNTVTNDSASEFSSNGEDWSPLPDGISPVTGKFDSQTSALVFDRLTLAIKDDLELDLCDYADSHDPAMPLKLMQGCSTICSARKDMRRHPDKPKSRIRDVIAIGRLGRPYCVRVR